MLNNLFVACQCSTTHHTLDPRQKMLSVDGTSFGHWPRGDLRVWLALGCPLTILNGTSLRLLFVLPTETLLAKSTRFSWYSLLLVLYPINLFIFVQILSCQLFNCPIYQLSIFSITNSKIFNFLELHCTSKDYTTFK